MMSEEKDSADTVLPVEETSESNDASEKGKQGHK